MKLRTERMTLLTGRQSGGADWFVGVQCGPRMPPMLEKPDFRASAAQLLAPEGINPNRMRKGKSGELPKK